jgi:hypothetical protein
MPTKDKDEGPVVKHSQAGKVAVDRDISDHRRKIIKASAVAIPVIMTLRSGAAAAVASAYQCFNHGPDTDTTDIDPVLGDDDLDPPHDEWLRMEAMKVVTEDDPPLTLYGVPNSGVVLGSKKSDYKEWYDKNGVMYEHNAVTGNEFNKGIIVNLLVYMNPETGEMTWYPHENNILGAAPITDSCMTSAMPNFNLNNLG